MTGSLVRIERHPIKSHGRETLGMVEVREGCALPFDRHWAVLHNQAKAHGDEWAPCANFSRVSKAPSLMAIDSTLDEQALSIVLRHPDRPPFEFSPDDPAELPAFLDWVRPLMPVDRAPSSRIVSAAPVSMTDSPYASISLLNLASIRALSDKLGRTLDPRRFRGNLWINGLAPWEEFDWIGKTLRIGGATFRVEEPIERCLATAANPENGRRDADTLGALNAGWGHQDMGVYLVALDSGAIQTGDGLALT